jgi:hypothetical protein
MAQAGGSGLSNRKNLASCRHEKRPEESRGAIIFTKAQAGGISEAGKINNR